LATLPESATCRSMVRPTSGQGAARPTSRMSWMITMSQLCSRNIAPESGLRINVFVVLWLCSILLYVKLLNLGWEC
jgi:hypothetical protein